MRASKTNGKGIGQKISIITRDVSIHTRSRIGLTGTQPTESGGRISFPVWAKCNMSPIDIVHNRRNRTSKRQDVYIHGREATFSMIIDESR